MVCGWSAGAGIATVVCRLARDAGRPTIVGQALLTPVDDSDQTRGSYLENADGYGLTAPLMRWFFDQYADPDVRDDPRIAPLRAADLSGLPPAIVVTSRVRPAARRGRRVRRSACRSGGSHPARAGPRTHTLVADDGRPGRLRRPDPRPVRRRVGRVLRGRRL